MKKGKAAIGFIIFLIIAAAAFSVYYWVGNECKVDSDCPVITCIRAPCPRYVCENGKCEQEQLIGGCAGVSLNNQQECCNRWADENGILVAACEGFWKVEEECVWTCLTGKNIKEYCEAKGGRWIEKQVGGFLDLGVDSDEECLAWGGSCERITDSFSIGKCDNENDCWKVDIIEPTCLLPKEIEEEKFCGSSTNSACRSDSDCIAGGCSGQICQGKDEPAIITTCEYLDCYDDVAFGVSCGCVSGKCKWS